MGLEVMPLKRVHPSFYHHDTCPPLLDDLIDRALLMNHTGLELMQLFEQKGHKPAIQPISEFLKAGSADKCLTLALT
jgi:hypothetical protein